MFLRIHKSNWVVQVCFKLAIDANASCYFEEILKYLFIDGGAESNTEHKNLLHNIKQKNHHKLF
jgi:hypothetical protein